MFEHFISRHESGIDPVRGAARQVQRRRRSPLDPGSVAALASHHFVSLLEGALAFAILAFLFLLAVALLHWVLRIKWASLAPQ
jgi:hypothetical protein